MGGPWLREPSKSSTALRRKLEEVFVEVHRLKGEASALGLDSFVEITHDFELNILDVKDIPELSGDDFLSLVVRLEKLVKHTESVQVLTDRLASFSSVADIEKTMSAGKLNEEWRHLSDLAELIAKRSSKQVSLVTSGLNELVMNHDQRSIINDLSIQCIRNAIVHGIELPQEREELNKLSSGRIDIRLSVLNSNSLELVISDDGYGIDVQRIRQAAIASGNWTEAQLESWDSKRIMSLIFETGFSTARQHTIDAGSGVGMDVIKKRVISMRGKIRIQSRRGVGARISVVLPNFIAAEVAA